MIELPSQTSICFWRRLLRVLAAAGFVAAGVLHFVWPDAYRRIVPPVFPAPALLVFVSGVFEILGGAGLLIRPLRSAAGWGLIALLIAVFPANVYMAIEARRFQGPHLGPTLLWLRLPLQGVLIFWIWWAAELRGIRCRPGVFGAGAQVPRAENSRRN